MIQFISILILIISVTLSNTQICFPNESLEQCLGVSESQKTENEEVCLGSKTGSVAFEGTCKYNNRNSCRTEYSRSAMCGSSGFCCKRTSTPSNKEVPNFPPISETQYYPSINEKTCGSFRVTLVKGGHLAERGSFPFMVAFTQNVNDPEVWKSFCGGVLISKNFVLSAAHCFDKVRRRYWKKNVQIMIGANDLTGYRESIIKANNEGDAEKKRKLRKHFAKIADVFIHPDYSKATRDRLNPLNDIALVKLKDVKSGNMPVCLPTSASISDDDTRWLTGYGSTGSDQIEKLERLVYAKINQTDISECRKIYRDFTKSVSGNVWITNKMICAGDETSDACSGDSGGPLMVNDNGLWTVVGIVSFGPSTCGQKVPGVYAKVENYLSWIRNTMKN